MLHFNVDLMCLIVIPSSAHMKVLFLATPVPCGDVAYDPFFSSCPGWARSATASTHSVVGLFQCGGAGDLLDESSLSDVLAPHSHQLLATPVAF